MSSLIEQGRYKAQITWGELRNYETFPSWELDLSFRLLGRVNPQDPGSFLPCPQVERSITTLIKEDMLDPVLKALGHQEHFWRQFEPGEEGSYGMEEGEVLVDCLHVQEGGCAEERWQLATRPFWSLKIDLAVRDADLRLPD